ncbi:acetyltransferase [Rhodoferax sp. 4810]|uniref:Acetyltransferase n=1 Tax=Thiospirillum jenense TaxID=1653858 RepID=A0A839HGS7_9GAMM|nr:acetyltransferase [Thiospirillum jenense]MBB1075877.1 acetyltransferase [Rhodoferax jenense]MBB1126099.1 acetyltransferase [Thiospirillum jenense]
MTFTSNPADSSPKQIDVFNGDADGLCALQQLRLHDPSDSQLITGVKRDSALLKRVTAAPGDLITVLDISLDKNRADLERLLAIGARVRYFDHHYAGMIPDHPLLDAHIDLQPQQGTSLLVNHWLKGQAAAWAIVGTFGDNFDQAAYQLAQQLGLNATAADSLRELGILLNYNGYGATVADLHFAPDVLFRALQPYSDPLAFIAAEPMTMQLRLGYEADMNHAQQLTPSLVTERHLVLQFPNEPWARRVSGVFINQLAQQTPQRAHALLTELTGGEFLISIRAPLAQPTGADQLARQFVTGGGRAAAAGINQLPASDYERFIHAFIAAF